MTAGRVYLNWAGTKDMFLILPLEGIVISFSVLLKVVEKIEVQHLKGLM